LSIWTYEILDKFQLVLFSEIRCIECILPARCASKESRFDLEKLKRDNEKLRLSVAKSAQGQESTKYREIRAVKHKECVVRFRLKKYLSLNFVKDSRVAKSASKAKILRGIKLRRDSENIQQKG
jgi:hypothetical protein